MKVTKCDLCHEEIPAAKEFLTHRLMFERGTGMSYRAGFDKEWKGDGEARSLTPVVHYNELCNECGAQITTALQVLRNERRKPKVEQRAIYVGPTPPPEGEGI